MCGEGTSSYDAFISSLRIDLGTFLYNLLIILRLFGRLDTFAYRRGLYNDTDGG